MDLLWIIQYQILENPRNEHLRGNLQIDQPNEIQIFQFICQWKPKNQRNLKRPKWSNSDLQIKSNWPQKFNFWLLMKDEQSSVKRQIGGSNKLRIRWICYPRKADEFAIAWIEGNLLGFFLADVRNSRGKFDKIKGKFVINPALIASQSSLNAGRSRWTRDLPQNFLNYLHESIKSWRTNGEYMAF